MKYAVTRSITIDQPLEKIRPLISDFKQWEKWSPWTVLEPDHARTFSGKVGTVGHTMTWDGQLIGQGQMSLTAERFDRLTFLLEFFKPFRSKATSEFQFKRVGKDQTNVTWIMSGGVPLFLFWLIPMMKFCIELDYKRGLIRLKLLSETGTIKAQTTNEGIVDFMGFDYVGIKKIVSIDTIGTEMKATFAQLMVDMDSKNHPPQHWLTLCPKTNVRQKTLTLIAATSTENSNQTRQFHHVTGRIASGKMLKITHRGSYELLGAAWALGRMVIQQQKLKKNGTPFEYYHNRPPNTPEADLLTDIYFPVK